MSFALGVQLTTHLPSDTVSAEILRLSSGLLVQSVLHKLLKSHLQNQDKGETSKIQYVALTIHFNQTPNEPTLLTKVTDR